MHPFGMGATALHCPDVATCLSCNDRVYAMLLQRLDDVS